MRPIFKPYVIKHLQGPGGKDVKVGILGLVTPGVAIWDKANVEGQVRFPGIVEQAKVMRPAAQGGRRRPRHRLLPLRGRHLGSSYGDALPYPENASRQLAEQVAGHRRHPRRARPRRDHRAPRRQQARPASRSC